MDALLLLLGRVAGFAGLLFCVAAVAIRLAGNYYVGSFQVVTFLEGGSPRSLLPVSSCCWC